MKDSKLRKAEKEASISKENKALNSISEFFIKNRKILIICGIVIFVGLIVLGVCLIVSDNRQDQLQIQVDALQTKSTDLFNTSDYTPEDYASLLAELEEVEKAGGSTYAGVKASYVIAQSYYKADDLDNAYTAYMNVVEKGSKTYLAPLAMFNAAVCKEDSGSEDEALALYEKVVADFGNDTGVAPKALFNSARIHLSKGETDLAKATFQQIVDQFTNSEYVALSKNALLTL